VDLVLVVGTSLAVAPMSIMLDLVPPEVPRVLINRGLIAMRSETPLTAALLGDADDIVHHLVSHTHALCFTSLCFAELFHSHTLH
jgi:NAD-dependent SIR2 family protein deacetylase